MARSAASDLLQVYPFWLMDVAPIEPFALPLFTPLLGFASISAPEITIETTDIVECNRLFTRKTLKRARVSTVSLTRGSRFYDADFWHWLLYALTGKDAGVGAGLPGVGSITFPVGGPSPRRNLLLIQFFARAPFSPDVMAGVAPAALSAFVVETGLSGMASMSTLGQLGAVTGAAVSGMSNLQGTGESPKDLFALRVPAKAWVLYGCLPTRYKPSGDFDAKSSDISVQELDIEPEEFEEICLGDVLGPVGGSLMAGLL